MALARLSNSRSSYDLVSRGQVLWSKGVGDKKYIWRRGRKQWTKTQLTAQLHFRLKSKQLNSSTHTQEIQSHCIHHFSLTARQARLLHQHIQDVQDSHCLPHATPLKLPTLSMYPDRLDDWEYLASRDCERPLYCSGEDASAQNRELFFH